MSNPIAFSWYTLTYRDLFFIWLLLPSYFIHAQLDRSGYATYDNYFNTNSNVMI